MTADILKNVREKRPIVHCITNYVTAADCANILLTAGASPIMADDPEEAAEVTSIADSLMLNTGTLSKERLRAMLLSGSCARERNIPILLDPVGAGVSAFRTGAVNSIISQVKPDVIRLNLSELCSISLSTKNYSGIDSHCEEDIEETIDLAGEYALKTGAVIGVSGEIDVVTDGTRTALIKGGHEMQRKITGSGCMLSCTASAFCAANTEDLFNAAVSAFGLFSACGKAAYTDGIGTASYKNNFFDAMTNPCLEMIEIEYR